MNRVVSMPANSTIEHFEELPSNTGDSSFSQYSQKKQEIEFSKFFLDYINDKIDEENNNPQSSKLFIERYEIHTVSTSSNTSFIPHKTKKTKNTLLEKEQLLTKIQHSYFEPGVWTEADAYFELLTTMHSKLEEPLSLLSDIVNHHLLDEHILEGVLHILSNYSYDDLEPFGITIALACTINHSPVIQDLLITCFENWNSADAIPILSGLKLETPWLAEYRDEVLEQLKSTEQIA